MYTYADQRENIRTACLHDSWDIVPNLVQGGWTCETIKPRLIVIIGMADDDDDDDTEKITSKAHKKKLESSNMKR